MRVQFRRVGGLRTRVLQEGTGFPLLLVHGLGTTAERWIRNIDALGARHAVFAPDLINSGFSDDVSFADGAPQLQHLRQLRQLVDDLQLTEFAVGGSSYGGLLATLLYFELPHRIRRLVIVGSGSALHPPDEQVRSLRAARANGLQALEDGTLAGSRKRLQNISYDPANVSEEGLLVQMTANAQPGRFEATHDLYDSLIGAAARPEYQAFHRLEQISVPTLIITGREDIRASWERAEEAARRIPDARLVILEQCGHAPMLEHAVRFNQEIDAFLEPCCVRPFTTGGQSQ